MSNVIVTVNVTQTQAPTPTNLQQKGALISQGGTTLSEGVSAPLTQLQDLVDIIAAPLALTSLSYSTGVVTATTTDPLPANFPTGHEFITTVADASPVGYNGQVLATVTGADTFTYASAALTSNVTPGTYTVSDELLAMATTFFAQGSQLSVSVLELGLGTPATGVTDLTAFVTANPGTFYSYLVPRAWDGESTFHTYLATFDSTTAKTYSHVTTTTSTYSPYTTHKAAVPYVEAPAIPLTEFSAAAGFWVSLHYVPSGTNRVTPFAFSFLFGVTAYPTVGNSALLATLKAAFINYVGTGAEGGLTNTILFWGTNGDGRDFSYWYSVDWIQLNLDLNVSNAVINGSNNPINPLYYNQDGINRLQDVAVATIQTAITDGMATGGVVRTQLDPTTFGNQTDAGTFTGNNVVNAIPFLTYLTANPNDYKTGLYAGFAVIYIPARGFEAIIFNVNVTDFLSQ